MALRPSEKNLVEKQQRIDELGSSVRTTVTFGRKYNNLKYYISHHQPCSRQEQFSRENRSAVRFSTDAKTLKENVVKKRELERELRDHLTVKRKLIQVKNVSVILWIASLVA